MSFEETATVDEVLAELHNAAERLNQAIDRAEQAYA